jgi:hypothetical protein
MTTIAVSQPSLEERLADAENELLVAQQTVGKCVLDGVGEHEAEQRVQAIRSHVEGLRLAQAEYARRAEEAAAAELERQEAIMRWKYVAWHAEYIERFGPVLRLRAELKAAEEHAMTLCCLTDAVGKNEGEIQADATLEPFDLPHKTTTVMRVHGVHTYCGGAVDHAEAGKLSTDDMMTWANRLAPLVEQAARAIGKDAKPGNLPWKDRASEPGIAGSSPAKPARSTIVPRRRAR